ncbi:sodium/glutamate symporter [Microvirga sp. GCM10011540]|uniref:sodium/glutamate symporter n=1 Tax=Microvirga sp. GCM10011540 TaxID=3317338 RepID=UPI003615B959
MSETDIPFYAAVALAGLAFVAVDLADRCFPWLRRGLPLPITAGLLAALVLLIPRAFGLPVRVPHQGVPVDFLIALLTTNMGLHLTPKVLRKGLPVLPLFLAAGFCLYWLQLLAVLPLALLTAHPLETAIVTGPLAFVGAPYNLNPPAQVPPIADLLRPAYPDPETIAQGMMMVGIILGPLLASWCGSRFFRRAGQEPPQPPAQHQRTPDVPLSAFGQRETHVLALILILVALAFGIQQILLAAVPGLEPDHLPVIVISYLLGGLTRFSVEKVLGPDRFPEAALTVLLLGPTMSFVLTYAIMSIPLHKTMAITPLMGLAGVMAVLSSAAFGWLLFPIFAKAAGRYYGAVIATAFIAVTTGWGPVAMSFLRRSTDERGEVEPMPAILPLNAFFIFPWMVILTTEYVFAVFGPG